MSTFFKQIYRYTRPRDYRHNENLWPYVKINRAHSGEITSLRYRGESIKMQKISSLQERYSGRILITATGPSINDMDFSRFPPMPVIGVNGAYALQGKINFQFYVIVDMTFIDKKIDVVQGVISNPEITLFTTLHGIVKVINAFSSSKIKCQVVIIEDACYKIYKRKVMPGSIWDTYCNAREVSICPDHKHIAFNHDIRTGIFDAGTVVYWALQIVAFLGFQTVYIAGLDMNNFNQPRFYENEKNKLPCFLDEKFANLIEPAFRHASQVLKKKGIIVKNLSTHSALGNDIFEKVNYDDIH
ncbi:sugar glycosyltransferase [Acerihabitans sp. TG2]|uniref:sugar glycosyltransferase n=1 Tax=Acerihabitans sp. TG2 TaxID=3096008 RepID=UPI002B229550|nr:sugar glycosyltransferase [Acerihabitans sp. TG2]MEA9392332.1 sugar glycosyltransferase [Acerihabitans sp. TG2]